MLQSIGSVVLMAILAQPIALTPFEREMQAAEYPSDEVSRDDAVEHLRRALELRPNHPENIHIEFKIGVMLSQQFDPKHQLPVERAAGLKAFENLLETYDVMEYYTLRQTNSTNDPQMLIPWAATLAGDLHMLTDRNVSLARERYIQSMACWDSVNRRRLRDSEMRLNLPYAPSFDASPRIQAQMEMMTEEERTAPQRKRRELVESGNTLAEHEMTVARRAVIQYCRSYDYRARPEAFLIAMARLKERFPGPPIATLADEYIDAAREDALEEALADVEDVAGWGAISEAELVESGEAAEKQMASVRVAIVPESPEQEGKMATPTSPSSKSDGRALIVYGCIVVIAISVLCAGVAWRVRRARGA